MTPSGHLAAVLVPDPLCRVHDKCEFGALVFFGYRIARHRRGKSALGADRQLVLIDMLRSLADASLEQIDISSRVATLLLTSPSTTPLFFTKRSGAKSPARSVSYSSRKWFTRVSVKKRSANHRPPDSDP